MYGAEATPSHRRDRLEGGMAAGVDLVLLGGSVWGHPDEVDAVAVADGAITAVGPAARDAAPAAHLVVDLAGGALLPGFGDGHMHPSAAARASLGAPVAGAASIGEVLDAVAGWAAEHPDAPWIRGDGYDPTLAEGGVFQAAWLDAVVPDRPVFLMASDFHTAWVNSHALQLAGIDSAGPFPSDGEVMRSHDGSPVGTLREWGAWGLVEAVSPQPPIPQLAEALVAASETCARHGITFVQDAWVEPRTVEVWLAAVASGRLAVGADLAQLARHDRWESDVQTLLALREEVERRGGSQVTARTVKLFADGVIESGTAALLAPYVDCPHSRGLPNWSPEDLTRAVGTYDALGFEVHIHAIGDAAVRTALDAIEATVATNPPRTRRPVIAHAQLIDPVDIARFAALRVVANVEPLWAQPDALMVELTEPRLGRDRAAGQYPFRSLIDSGAAVSFGSDWPVSSLDPRAGIATAVTRQRPDGQPPGGWLPQERISLEEAVAAYTQGVAHQSGGEDVRGRIEIGMQADLVHLAADPREVAPLDLPGVEILATWRAGRRTFGAAGTGRASG
jgi:predicted amidohydrolase YtcJ